jgi:hypothetical protein
MTTRETRTSGRRGRALICLIVAVAWIGALSVAAVSEEWFDDFFFSRLDSAWTIQREDAASWSLSERRGFLEIIPRAGAVQDGTVRNLFLRDAPSTVFELETSILIDTPENGVRAGLVLVGTGSDFVTLELAPCLRGDCAAPTVQLAVNGTTVGEGAANDAPRLRLTVDGGAITAEWSSDGTTWEAVGSASISGDIGRLGLAVEAATDGGSPVDFDYVRLTYSGTESTSPAATQEAQATTEVATAETPAAEETPALSEAAASSEETAPAEEETTAPVAETPALTVPEVARPSVRLPQANDDLILVSVTSNPNPDLVQDAYAFDSWDYRILSLDIDTGDVADLSGAGAVETDGVWSPNRDLIALREAADPLHDYITVLDPSDGSRERLTDGTKQQRLPTWNPTGTEVAFVQLDAVGLASSMNVRGESHVYERGDAAIMAVGLDGGTRTLYGPTRDWIADLEWSPAGDWIAFTYDTGSAIGLAVIRPDGSSRTRVTSLLSRRLDAAWSPDGRRLAYISASDSSVLAWDAQSGQIETFYEPDWAEFTRVSYIIGLDWSPDGRRLALLKYETWGGERGDQYYVEIVTPGTRDTERFDVPDRALSISWN